jgi:uncharacterized membrane protein
MEATMTSYAVKSGQWWRGPLPVLVVTALATFILWLLSQWAGVGRATAGKIPGHDVALLIHLVCALAAVPLGAFVLWRPKGTATHQLLGRTWAVLMLVVAVSSYWLRTLNGGFSYIHLLSVLTLVSLPFGIYQAGTGNIAAHLRTMRGLYIGLVVAGGFAMAPNRKLGELLFGW